MHPGGRNTLRCTRGCVEREDSTLLIPGRIRAIPMS